MAKAKKLPSGQWRTLVYDYTDTEEKRHYKSFTADTRKESEYFAAEFALKKTDKRHIEKKTFGDALDEYIELRTAVLSPGTIREYKRSRKADIQELMNIKICDITQEIIQKIINDESKTHSPKSVRNMHGLVSAVLKVYRPDFALNTILPKKVRPNIYVPSDSQIQVIIDYVRGTDMEIPVLLAAFGPMRRSEICALNSMNISGNKIYVKFAMVQDEDGKWVLKPPKSYAGDRIINFPDFVAERLKEVDGKATSLNPNMITKRFEHVLSRTGVPHFRFHDLRHYSASIQHALGIPDQYIMQRGGWASDIVLKNVYRHTMSDTTEKMNDVANEHFKTLCNTKCNTV